jgi:hypothetical protein
VLRFNTLLGHAVGLPVALVALVACGGPPPTKMVANGKDDGVPANSASEQRLASGTAPKTAAGPAEDPTQPLTTPMGGDPSAAGAGAAGSGGTAGGGATGKGGPKKGDPKDPKVPKEKEPKSTGSKVSKAECKQIFDKYIDLTLASDTRFEGIPPEMIAQLKEQALSQAQSQKGDPCSTQEVSRTQYTCAMSAPTTAAWQRCMK